MRGIKSTFSWGVPFCKFGLQQTQFFAREAVQQQPTRSLPAGACGQWVTSGLADQVAALKVIIKGPYHGLYHCPQGVASPRQEQMFLLFLRLLLSLTPMPARSTLTTTGTSVSRSSESCLDLERVTSPRLNTLGNPSIPGLKSIVSQLAPPCAHTG